MFSRLAAPIRDSEPYEEGNLSADTGKSAAVARICGA
jgi:hypothetical protein